MSKTIGQSAIFGLSGDNGFAGPRGATGVTGADQTIAGPTGPTGLDSNYVKEILVNKQTGNVTLVFADDTLAYDAGTLKGASGIYAGITYASLGNGIPVIRGVCGGVTLEFYNFSPDSLIGITIDSDKSLKFLISPNSVAAGLCADIEPNKIIYAPQKNAVSTTYLDVRSTTPSNKLGEDHYSYVNFGGLTGGRSVVANITDSELSVGPIERGNTVITVEPFYKSGPNGITLDLSYASVYKIVTPIGIKAFTTDDAPISNGQACSVTLIVEGDDVWNFPDDVIFDTESKAVFYPGTNILHLWKTNNDNYWKASFTARGFNVNQVTNPGIPGSCCYSDADGVKHCKEYVTENYCIELDGTFAGLVPCERNPCLVAPETIDGICCTEGKCVSDIDPDLCSTIGGYFISGITCGQSGEEYPETSDTNNNTGLCYNKCKSPTVCCKDGTCLGNLTKIHCENILGGKILPAANCGDVQCCDLIEAPGACCIPGEGGVFTCETVQTPYECKTEKNGLYMGINSVCTESICCNVPIDTCYECVQTQTGCNCNPVDIYTGTCESQGLSQDCTGCQRKTCRKCVCGTPPCEQIEVCNTCPDGYTEGSCATSTCNQTVQKTCYAACSDATGCNSKTVSALPCKTCQDLINDGVIDPIFNENSCDCPCSIYTKTCYKCKPDTTCDSVTVTLGDDEIAPCNATCQQLIDLDIVPPDYELDSCICDSYAACFWCYPNITGVNNEEPSNSRQLGSEDDTAWRELRTQRGLAPYRAVHIVPKTIYDKLEAEEEGITHAWTYELGGGEPPFEGYMGPMIASAAGLLNSWKGYHYYEFGGRTDSANSTLYNSGRTKYVLPMGVPFSDSAQYYCTYLGSYELTQDSALNKEKCLTRFGYDTPYLKSVCRLCDPPTGSVTVVDPRNYTWTDPDDPETAWRYTIQRVEPYQPVIERNIKAPFPPIWGRLSMFNLAQTCSGGGIREATNNLALFHPRLSLDMAKAFAGKANNLGVSKGYLWWSKYIENYDIGFLPPQGTPEAQVALQYRQDMTAALNFQLGQKGNKCTNTLSGYDACVCGGVDIPTNPCPSPAGSAYIPFDPYRMGGQAFYVSSTGYEPVATCPNISAACPNDCDLFGYVYEGWSHYSVPFGPETTTPSLYEDVVSDPTGVFNWYDNRELWYQRYASVYTPATVGNNYSCAQSDNWTESPWLAPEGVPRGILGRNLRYNLFEFNTSTVFFDEDGITPTMMSFGFGGKQHNPPIFKWTFWQAPPGGGGGCHQQGGGPGVGNCNECCVDDPANGVCCTCPLEIYTNPCTGEEIPSCGLNSSPCQTCPCEEDECGGPICAVRCCEAIAEGCGSIGTCNGPHCDPDSNDSGGSGSPLLDPNTPNVFEQTNSEVTIRPIKSKNVSIAPGVCVNMLCPECDLYESC